MCTYLVAKTLSFLSAHRMVTRMAVSPQHGGDITLLLPLLDASVRSSDVRSFAVNCLRQCQLPCSVLKPILLQLVQCLKSESRCFSALFDFLMEQALQHPLKIGLALFWIVSTEIDTKDGLHGIGEVIVVRVPTQIKLSKVF